MSEESRVFDNPGVAVLRATMQTLSAAVTELTQENRRDREDLVSLRGKLDQVATEVSGMRGRLEQIAQQIAPNAAQIERSAVDRIQLTHTLDAMHARMDAHEKAHLTTWTRVGGVVFWVFAGVVGFLASLLGELIKRTVLGQ